MSEYRGFPQKKNDKNFSILSRFLSKITPKERDTNKSFHDRIDKAAVLPSYLCVEPVKC